MSIAYFRRSAERSMWTGGMSLFSSFFPLLVLMLRISPFSLSAAAGLPENGGHLSKC